MDGTNKIDNGSDMLMKKRFVLRWNVSNEEGYLLVSFEKCIKFYYWFAGAITLNYTDITKIPDSFYTPGQDLF